MRFWTRARARGAGGAAAVVIAAVVFGAFPSVSAQAEDEWRHATSLVGEPRYGPNFTHFDFVNPDAPKGGEVRLANTGGFDSLNAFIPKGEVASGLGLIYDTLFAVSIDESSTSYGLVAEAMRYPADYSSVTFRLRPEARFHDGEPIKPEDVIFSLEILMKSHPFYGKYYANVAKAEKTGPHEVTFTFDVTGNRELPHILGELIVLPRHYWEAEDHDFSKTSLEPPLGSGPYRIGKVDAPELIIYERVENYWAQDLPANRGFNNFDRIRYDSYQDGAARFEAFKAGKLDYMHEPDPGRWVKSYDFPAVENGHVVKFEHSSVSPRGMQAFVLNNRRATLSDRRVRLAFNLAFDFKWSNANVSYGLNTRNDSYFDESELASSDLPTGRELEILEEFRGRIPNEVFTRPFTNPVHEDETTARRLLGEAHQLLLDAGWSLEGGKRIKDGVQIDVEFLLSSKAFEQHVLNYKKNLEKLGINVRVRILDPSQYTRRVRSFDYDIIVGSWGQSLSPGNEQREFFGSNAAKLEGSRNTAGIADPVVDALIDKVIFAKDRPDLVSATRALDRVLLWNFYVVPHWWRDSLYVRWDRFGAPTRPPGLSTGFPAAWWYDDVKAARIASPR